MKSKKTNLSTPILMQIKALFLATLILALFEFSTANELRYEDQEEQEDQGDYQDDYDNEDDCSE